MNIINQLLLIFIGRAEFIVFFRFGNCLNVARHFPDVSHAEFRRRRLRHTGDQPPAAAAAAATARAHRTAALPAAADARHAANEPADEPAAGRDGDARPHGGLPAAFVLVRSRPRDGQSVLPQSTAQLLDESQPAAAQQPAADDSATAATPTDDDEPRTAAPGRDEPVRHLPPAPPGQGEQPTGTARAGTHHQRGQRRQHPAPRHGKNVVRECGAPCSHNSNLVPNFLPAN
jgi:hypothetical protein